MWCSNDCLGMAATGAQYGVAVVHQYWIGAIPAMVFLGLVMMPFFYRSEVRSVPEFLLQRFDRSAHLLSSVLFAFAAILIAGVSLCAGSSAASSWPTE
ncbi:Na+/proline symporter [Streptomyces sp. TE33382]